mmetsp:Transcript_30554/g.76492  ORF Transcript_30554/g.76492 Transcript_30554/m.76492 type:complete len:139 (+) Transcript_30554:242-658(+)
MHSPRGGLGKQKRWWQTRHLVSTPPVLLILTRCHVRRQPTCTHFWVPEQRHGETRSESTARGGAPRRVDVSVDVGSSSSSPTKQKRQVRPANDSSSPVGTAATSTGTTADGSTFVLELATAAASADWLRGADLASTGP